MDTGNTERKSWWREDPEDDGDACSPNSAPEGRPPRGGSSGEMAESGELPEIPGDNSCGPEPVDGLIEDQGGVEPPACRHGVHHAFGCGGPAGISEANKKHARHGAHVPSCVT